MNCPYCGAHIQPTGQCFLCEFDLFRTSPVDAYKRGRQAGIKETVEVVRIVSPSKDIIRSDTFLDGFWDAKSRMMEALLKEVK